MGAGSVRILSHSSQMVWDIPPGQGALLLILLGSGIPSSCPKGCHQQGWLPQQCLSRSPVPAIPPLGCSHPAAAEMEREHLPGATASPLLFTCCQQACEICIRHWVRCYLEHRMYLWQWSVWTKISPKYSMNCAIASALSQRNHLLQTPRTWQWDSTHQLLTFRAEFTQLRLLFSRS